jgi:hypothetical protein
MYPTMLLCILYACFQKPPARNFSFTYYFRNLPLPFSTTIPPLTLIFAYFFHRLTLIFSKTHTLLLPIISVIYHYHFPRLPYSHTKFARCQYCFPQLSYSYIKFTKARNLPLPVSTTTVLAN